MAVQTISLGNPTTSTFQSGSGTFHFVVIWEPSGVDAQVNNDFKDEPTVGGQLFLRRFYIQNITSDDSVYVDMRFSFFATGSDTTGSAYNEEISMALEQFDPAFTLVLGNGVEIPFAGPDNANNIIRDDTGYYSWRLSDTQRLAFYNAVLANHRELSLTSNVSLRLNDGLSVPLAPNQPTFTSVTNTGFTANWAEPHDNDVAVTDYDLRYSTDQTVWTQIPDTTPMTVTSYGLSGLTQGTTYYVQVRAQNSNGESAWSTAGQIAPQVLPAAPTAPSVSDNNGVVTLTWSEPDLGGGTIEEYDVRVSTDEATWTTHNTASQSARTWSIGTLTSGNEYYFQVRAENQRGEGPWSPSTAHTISSVAQPPDAPVISTTSLEASRYRVGWTEPNNNGAAITSYTARQRRSGVATWIETTGITTLYTDFSGLTRGRTYEVQVRAVNSAGNSPWSTTLETTPQGVPLAPTNIIATAGNGQVTLAWDAADAQGGTIVDYDAQWTTANSGWQDETEATYTGTSTIITGLSNGELYTFRVRSRNQRTTSAWSTQRPQATPVASAATAPPAPSPPVVSNLAATSLTLSWSLPSSTGGASLSGTDYRYTSVASPQDSDWTVVEQTWSNTAISFTANLTGLSHSTGYQFQVRFENAQGNGAWSTTTSATTSVPPATVPAAPTVPTSSNVAHTSFRLGWTAPDSGGATISAYHYRWTTVASPQDSDWTEVTTGIAGTAVFVNVTGLTASTTYYYQLRAVNSVGNGAWSPTLTVTTTATPAGTVPGAPESVSHTVGSLQVTINWTPPTSDGGSAITSYQIQWRPVVQAEPSWTIINKLSTDRSHVITGLSNNNRYTYSIRAVNAVGNGPWYLNIDDEYELFRPLAATATAPAQVGTVTATAGDGNVALSWSAPNNGGATISEYDVEYSTDGNNWTLYLDGTLSATSRTVSGLTNGTQYSFRVRAENSVGAGDWSATVTATPTAPTLTVPGAPGTPTYTVTNNGIPSGGSGSIVFSWTAPTTGGAVATYETDSFIDGVGDTTDFDATGITGTSQSFTFTDPGTAAVGTTVNTGQQVFVRAVNAAGNSSWSGRTTEISYTVLAAPSAPTEAPGVPGTPLRRLPGAADGTNDRDYDMPMNGSVDIEYYWSAPTTGGAVATYELNAYGGSPTDTRFDNYDATGITTTSHTITYDYDDFFDSSSSIGDRTANTPDVQVRARNSVGVSSYTSLSGWVRFTVVAEDTTPPDTMDPVTPTVPDAPEPIVTVISSEEIRVDWGEPNDGGATVTAYAYQYATSTDFASGDRVGVSFASDGMDTAPTTDIRWQVISSGGSTNTFAVIFSNLSPSTTYYFRARAVNANGFSQWSEIVTVTNVIPDVLPEDYAPTPIPPLPDTIWRIKDHGQYLIADVTMGPVATTGQSGNRVLRTPAFRFIPKHITFTSVTAVVVMDRANFQATMSHQLTGGNTWQKMAVDLGSYALRMYGSLDELPGDEWASPTVAMDQPIFNTSLDTLGISVWDSYQLEVNWSTDNDYWYDGTIKVILVITGDQSEFNGIRASFREIFK